MTLDKEEVNGRGNKRRMFPSMTILLTGFGVCNRGNWTRVKSKRELLVGNGVGIRHLPGSRQGSVQQPSALMQAKSNITIKRLVGSDPDASIQPMIMQFSTFVKNIPS